MIMLPFLIFFSLFTCFLFSMWYLGQFQVDLPLPLKPLFQSILVITVIIVLLTAIVIFITGMADHLGNFGFCDCSDKFSELSWKYKVCWDLEVEEKALILWFFPGRAGQMRTSVGHSHTVDKFSCIHCAARQNFKLPLLFASAELSNYLKFWVGFLLFNKRRALPSVLQRKSWQMQKQIRYTWLCD